MNAKLSSEQKAALEKQHKTERDRRIADRIKAVLLSAEGLDTKSNCSSLENSS